jgi:hypothetical protein
MSHATIIIDGQTRLNTDLSLGPKRPPQALVDLMKPDAAKREPWLSAAAIPLAEAVMNNQPITITIDTRPGSWDMHVSHHAMIDA